VPGADAVALSARLLQADPLDESALAAHVGWLQRTGQQAAARAAHARFVERMAEELDLAPGAQLVALGESLQPSPALTATRAAASATAVDGGDAASTPAPSRAAAAERPIDAGFIGRGAELRRIAALVDQDDCRLVCLLGPGGIGKTRLARHALEELAPGFADGAVFVPLEDASDAGAAGQAFLRALELRAESGSDPWSTLIAELAGKRMLIVLDNLETLPGAADLVQRLLDGCPGLKLIATSRARLNLAAEWSLPLDGLPCPDLEDDDLAESFDAVRLFVRSARRVDPDFSAATESEAVAAICRLVDGLPLAIELIAAWVRLLSCRDILLELRAGTELLRTPETGRPGRHASIERVFEQSWLRLGDAERDALGKLSVFRGGFDAAAARAITGSSLAVLGSLTDKSLLHQDGARLRLHPLVQQLAAAKLSADVRKATEQAHSARYLQFVLGARKDVESGDGRTLRQIEIEGDNCRAAWRWAATEGPAASADTAAGERQAGVLAQAALVLMQHADHRGERQLTLVRAGRALESPAAQRHVSLRAVLLCVCGFLAHRLDRLDEGRRWAEEALRIVGPDAAHEIRIEALRVLFGCDLKTGRLDTARRHGEAALVLAREAGDPRMIATILGNLSQVEKRLGRYPESLALALEALEMQRKLGSFIDEARSLNNLADLEMMMGSYAPAEGHLLEGLVLAERHGLRSIQGLILANLSFAAERRGDLDTASRRAREALPVLAERGDRINGAAIRQQLAMLEVRRGRAEAAAAELSAAFGTGRETKSELLLLHGLIVAVELIALGDPPAALALLEFAVAHPAAEASLRAEADEHRGALAARVKEALPAWPSALGLEQVVACIADDARQGIETLRRAIRGGAIATATRAA
jgi:predicted ATPase